MSDLDAAIDQLRAAIHATQIWHSTALYYAVHAVLDAQKAQRAAQSAADTWWKPEPPERTDCR